MAIVRALFFAVWRGRKEKMNENVKKHSSAYRSASLRKLVFSALLFALAYVLPYFTGQIQQIGQMLCPMHLPVILCGFLCGWQWGAVVGFTVPIIRSLTNPMPPMYPTALGMAFELAAYGIIAGIMFRALPKKLPFLYVDLLTAMLCGRIVWGTARFFLAGLDPSKFGLAAFWTGAVADAIPGIIVQIVLIPPIVFALSRANLAPNIETGEKRA